MLTTDHETFSLPRTGSMPFAFHGKRLAHASGKELPRWDKRNRWHEITLYRTDNDRYVVHAAFRATTEYETDNDQVRVFDNEEGAIQWLWRWHQSENCLAAVQGWPLERHQDRNNSLRRELLNQFSTLIGKVIAKIL